MDLQEAFDKGFDSVKAYIDRSFDIFEKRILAMEATIKAIPVPKDGKDGKDADPKMLEVLQSSIGRVADRVEEVRSMVVSLPPVPELPDIPTLVNEAVAAAIPEPIKGDKGEPGTDGKSVSVEDIMPRIQELVASSIPEPIKGEPGAPGADGKSVSIDEVRSLVQEAVAEIPVPKDGKDGVDAPAPTIDQIRSAIFPEGEENSPLEPVIAKYFSANPPKAGEKGAPKERNDPKAPGPAGPSGIGLAGLVIDRDGGLVATLSNGETKTLGPVVGKDGKDGLDGSPGAPGTDGAPGAHGKDGFGWDDMDEFLDEDGRTIVRRYKHGDDVKEFRHKFAVVIYRGVWQEGKTYDAGDSVTWGGQTLIAKKQTSEKPEVKPGGSDWQLAVKRGRDGKDGVVKEPPSGKVKI